MRLEPKHWIILATMISGVATQLLTAHNWTDTFTPAFVAGMLLQVCSGVTALFVGKPGAEAELARANKNTDMANASTKAALSQPMDTTKVDPKRYLCPEDLDIG